MLTYNPKKVFVSRRGIFKILDFLFGKRLIENPQYKSGETFALRDLVSDDGIEWRRK